MSKNLLDIVAACNKESKQSLTSRLDIYDEKGSSGKDNSLSGTEMLNAIGTWMTTDYFKTCVAKGRFDLNKFMILASQVKPTEEFVNIPNYLNPPAKLDPNDPEYIAKRFNLVPHGHGCTRSERWKFKTYGIGKICDIPEEQTKEEKSQLAAKH